VGRGRLTDTLGPVDAVEVVRVLDALDAVGLGWGITGGWGIDALLRRETRSHADLDLGIASEAVDDAIDALEPLGYVLVRDERPARAVLTSELGQVDLHPIVWQPSRDGVQTGLNGETFDYPAGSLDAEGEIAGRAVRCGTPELQVAFHGHYEPRDHDRRDMAALAAAFDMALPRAYTD
jgi:lincosamide nucleotidyltransferase A/C/D/E